jgi:C_GCAxxG_C_C family probable redox protein
MGNDRRDFLKIMTSTGLAAAFGPWSVSRGQEKKKPGTEDAAQQSRAEKALALMGKYGSCCTGVLGAYAPEVEMDLDLAAGAGRGMAGGIGGLGHVCGAVSGAALVIGLKTTNEHNINDMEAGFKTMDTVKEFVTRFEERHSSIMCRELIGHDISTQEKSAAAMKANAFVNCPAYVQSAVTLLDDMLE